jgi:hypothetical protein
MPPCRRPWGHSPLDGGDYEDAFSNFDAGETVKFDFSGRGYPLMMRWIK